MPSQFAIATPRRSVLVFVAGRLPRSSASASRRALAADRLVFVGQLTTAGGLELLRSVLQEFTRLKQRMHVTLAGCVGRAPYGDPFQFVAETLSDLKHDFAFVLSNDPMVLLDALDGTALIMVADRLALRTPMLDLLRARGLPVLDLTPADWIESWRADTSDSLCGVMLSAVPPRHGCARCSMPAQCSCPHRRWNRPPPGSPLRTADGSRRGRAGYGPMRNRAPSCSAGTRRTLRRRPAEDGYAGRWFRVVAGRRRLPPRIASRSAGPA